VSLGARSWWDAPGAEGGLGPVGGLELVEDAGDVVLHGLQRDAEGAGDLLVAGTLGQQVEDLAFPRGQVVRPGWARRAGEPIRCAGQEPTGDPGAEDAAAISPAAAPLRT